jgi:hypothetical protein
MTEQPTGQQARFVSLRAKLLVGFTLLFSVVFAGAYYWFYQFATEMALTRIEEDLVATLNAASEGVDGDEFAALAREGVPREDGLTDDPRYWEHLAWLETIHDIEPRAYPYTYVKGEEQNELLFIGDILVAVDPSRAAGFRESYVSKGPMYQGLSGLTLHTRPPDAPYTDKWGSWVSAYAPIKNSEGENVGGMGIDFRAEYVLGVQQAIRNRVMIAAAVTYPLLVILIYLVAGAVTGPVMTLTGIAERIGEGDYGQDLSRLVKERFPDEIDTLARVFEVMVAKVREREQSLRKRVEELQIMVDQTKRDKQVSEIVDSDFFQDLQDKARSMRKRSAKTTSD